MHRCRQNTNLKSDIVLAAEIRKADEGDPDTLVDSVMEAQNNLNQAGSQTQIEEVAADKGYHAAHTLELSEAVGLRTYIPEPRRRPRLRWTDKPAAYQPAVYANRRRIKRAKSKRWQRRRSELCERTFAHVCDCSGTRRSWLRGVAKVGACSP
jgi:transposase